MKQPTWRDWVDEDFAQRSTQGFPGLNVDQIRAFIGQGLREFYLRPCQMGRMFRNIQTIPDLRAKLRGLKCLRSYFRNKEGAFVGFVGNN